MKIQHLFENPSEVPTFAVRRGDILNAKGKREAKKIGEIDGFSLVSTDQFHFIGLMHGRKYIASINGNYHKENPKSYRVWTSMVDEAYRGKGLSAKLLKFLLDKGLTVTSGNAISPLGIWPRYAIYKEGYQTWILRHKELDEPEFFPPGLSKEEFRDMVYKPGNHTELAQKAK